MHFEEQFQDQMARLFPENNAGLARTVTFQVTDSCNLRCTYCYQINKAAHKMDFETAKKFTDILLSDRFDYINTKNSCGIIIEFIGGEPLLEIDLITQITDYFITSMIEMQHPWATRFRLSICSNGLLYFDEKWQNYLRRYGKYLSFSISIDGCKELHDSCRLLPDGSGSYDIAMAGVKDYQENKKGKMGSKMTLAPENIRYTYKAYRNFIENGYREINLNCVYEADWTAEHALILYDELKKIADDILENNLEEELFIAMFQRDYFKAKSEDDVANWCGGTGLMISCDWKGDIYPCIRYMESSLGTSQKPLIIGNVDVGVGVLQEHKDAINMLNAIDRRTQSTDECFYCPIAEGCSWCSAYNYQHFGTPNKRVTNICIMHKARSLANVYYWNKLYKKHNEDAHFIMNCPKEWALEIISEEEYNMLLNLTK